MCLSPALYMQLELYLLCHAGLFSLSYEIRSEQNPPNWNLMCVLEGMKLHPLVNSAYLG